MGSHKDLQILDFLIHIHKHKLMRVSAAAPNRYGKYRPPYHGPIAADKLNHIAIITALKDCAGQRSEWNVRLAERIVNQ